MKNIIILIKIKDIAVEIYIELQQLEYFLVVAHTGNFTIGLA